MNTNFENPPLPHWIALLAMAVATWLAISGSRPGQRLFGDDRSEDLISSNHEEARTYTDDEEPYYRLGDEGGYRSYWTGQDTDGDGCSNLAEKDLCRSVPGAEFLSHVRPRCRDVQDPTQITPALPEVCDGVNNDCDWPVRSEEDNPVDGHVYYYDVDGDGFGRTDDTEKLCKPRGYYTADVGGDCNDGEYGNFVKADADFEVFVDPAEINPNALEFEDDFVDTNCDGFLDEESLQLSKDYRTDQELCDDGNPCTWDYPNFAFRTSRVESCEHDGGFSNEKKCGPGEQGVCQNGTCVPLD